ncbi:MAG: hypothetical protein H0W35_06220 [Actinobacteria bacterium]|nr:hypothetical protein [Actinomycetota bacterium]
MATRGENERDHERVRGVVRPRGVDETKAAFKTTEIIAYIATVVGVLIAAKIDDGLDGGGAWTLITALTIGYLVSRGLAKSGSKHREDRDTI